MVPHGRRRTYDARDLDEALRQAAADDDWEDQDKNYDGSTDTKFTGAWRRERAYVGPDVLASKRPNRCAYCGERKTVADETWQQWRCGACGSWNDKPQPGGEPVEVLGRAAAFIAERGERDLAAAVRRAFEAILAAPKLDGGALPPRRRSPGGGVLAAARRPLRRPLGRAVAGIDLDIGASTCARGRRPRSAKERNRSRGSPAERWRRRADGSALSDDRSDNLGLGGHSTTQPSSLLN